MVTWWLLVDLLNTQPILIASRRDWHRLKGLLKGFKLALRPCESSKNWWRYDRMKFVTDVLSTTTVTRKTIYDICFLLTIPTNQRETTPLNDCHPVVAGQ